MALRQIRNSHIARYESAFGFLNVLGAILGWILLILGCKFAYNGVLVNGRFGLERLRGAVVLLIFFMFLLIEVFMAIGMCLSTRRGAPWPLVSFYAASILLFIAIPLFAEGSELLKISRINEADADLYCSLFPQDFDRFAPKWTREIFMISSRYDDVTEQLVDDNMCTKDVCPCLDYNRDEPRANPKLLYREHLESFMERYNRTNYNNSYWTKRGDIPLYFTESANEGFRSFMECLEHWENKAMKDSSIRLDKVFNVSKTAYQTTP